ncbi:uncharacterized protein C8R40DRAFT_916278 [Lentinula edodes]|uniref:uncharacterized protein n=1 Tax=Lentinula edodes TaxID=5353 RepID=UPI001E8DA752|nr:uncharacterized protein C8R40DRAFT_916278 [Lentinula edodes]KAH7867761.1 hypothetical protein C8R40DRAFT_916278 [Lentinula edodes]
MVVLFRRWWICFVSLPYLWLTSSYITTVPIQAQRNAEWRKPHCTLPMILVCHPFKLNDLTKCSLRVVGIFCARWMFHRSTIIFD